MPLPVKVGVEIVPVAVVACACVPSALPVKVGTELVPVAVSVCPCVPSALPVNVGTELVPVAVVVCECVPSADPENVGVVLVGTPAGQESVCVCAEPAALVTALFVTLCVSVAFGPFVVPVATPPVLVAVE